METVVVRGRTAWPLAYVTARVLKIKGHQKNHGLFRLQGLKLFLPSFCRTSLASSALWIIYS